MKALSVIGAELRCPELEASRDFFTDALGLLASDEDADSCRLRCAGEDVAQSLVLRRAARPGIDAVVVRADQEAQGELVAPAAAGGHRARVVTERRPAPAYGGGRPVLNQPAPLRGIGVEPRRLAHVGLAVENVEAATAWWGGQLGFAVRETVEDSGGLLLATVAVTAQACDLMLVRAGAGEAGALHHVAFAVDQRDTIARAALLFAERAIPVEVGLGQHGVGQLSYLYCFEPSGNRIALVHSPLLFHEPAHPAVHWPAEARELALMLWGAPAPASFFDVTT